MPLEIERKFLVNGESWRAQVQRSQAMHQGYLAGEAGRASVRVRVEGEHARLNIKAAVVGRSRAEYDYEIPLSHAQEILETLCVGRVQKTRHFIDQGELTWEIDEFEGANTGLLVAEIELPSEDYGFDTPGWLGREVTEEQRYYNHALSLRPYKEWSDADRG